MENRKNKTVELNTEAIYEWEGIFTLCHSQHSSTGKKTALARQRPRMGLTPARDTDVNNPVWQSGVVIGREFFTALLRARHSFSASRDVFGSGFGFRNVGSSGAGRNSLVIMGLEPLLI